MGKKIWTEDDEIYLNYYLSSNEEKNYESAANFLNCSRSQITKKANKMRVKGETEHYINKPFDKWEIDYLKKHYYMIPTTDIAELLSRSRETIIWKANSLGLTKLDKVRNHDSEIRRLAKEGFTRATIARKLGLKANSVGDYINRNNISCRYATREEMGGHFRELEQARYNEMKKKYNY